MDTLRDSIRHEVQSYTGKGLNGYGYMIAGSDPVAWTVVSVGYIDGERIASADLIVRLIGSNVVIERDDNDPPLVDSLVQAGISRSQIILAYAGEPVPESV
jgi:hypothetical protein